MLQKLFLIMFILLGLSIQMAFAQVWESAENNENLTEPEIREFQESDFQNYPWMKEFTNVVVVNKANEGSDKQTLRLYVNGKLQLLTKISSGRETYEKGCAPGQDPKKDHCSIRAYWSTTPIGYFDVDTTVANHYSNLWKTWMPYAVFFEGGIATHQAPAGTEGKLGSRASGGCVRMHPNSAPIVFKAVNDAGKGLVPKVDRNGDLKKTSAGDTIRAIGFKTLVIVQNVIKK